MSCKKDEIKWVIKFSLLVIMITTIPYIIAYFKQGDNWVFSGFLFGVEDGNSYIAKMLSGANQSWLFKTPYSSMEQNGFIAFIPYLLLGKLSSAPGQHVQLVMLFQIFRWAGILFLCYSSYLFISLFIQEIKYKRLILFLSMMGGGLGWMGIPFTDTMPLEFYSPETFGFLSVFGIPHLLFSKGLLLSGLTIFMGKTRHIKNTLLVGLCWFLIGFFQPLTIPIGWAVMGAYILVGILFSIIRRESEWIGIWKREIFHILIIVGITSPWVIYNLFSFYHDSFLKGWYSQNIIQSPEPVYYFISIGLLIPFAIWGLVPLLKEKRKTGYLALGWLIIFPVLIYFPISTQRRLAEGIWTLIVILFVLFLINHHLKEKIIHLITIPLLICSTLLYMGAIQATLIPQSPIFIPVNEIAMFKFLGDNTTSQDIIMAPYEISNPLPAWVYVRTVMGHGPESVNLKEIKKDWELLHKTNDPQEKENIIQKFHPRYIILENKDSSLKNMDTVRQIYINQDYSIYQFQE